MNKEDYVVVIGGANIDILGIPDTVPVFHDSNPGRIKTSLGGVGRNIAENLSNLGIRTKFISAIGNDEGGKRIVDQCRKSGIGMDYLRIVDGGTTSSYISILDEKGDLLVALSDMDIVNQIDIPYIKQFSELIKKSSILVIDTNLSENTIDYLMNNFQELSIIADTVSTAKAGKLKNHLAALSCIKPNKQEAEILTGTSIEREEDYFTAVSNLVNRGVDQVYLTAGEEGVYYADREGTGHFLENSGEIVNANGAGDMFTAALIYCRLNNFPMDYTARFATWGSILTTRHIETIDSEISVNTIEQQLNQI